MQEGLPQDSPQTIAILQEDLVRREKAIENATRPIISKDTLIPIGVVLGSLTTIVFVVWFASSLTFKVQAAEVRLDKIEDAITKLTDVQVQLSGITENIKGIQEQINRLTK